jgi:hypothetical protein
LSLRAWQDLPVLRTRNGILFLIGSPSVKDFNRASVPRKQWMEAFDYKGRGSTEERRRVIRTIYGTSVPIPGPALDPRSEVFLREVRLLVHDAIRDGGGRLVFRFYQHFTYDFGCAMLVFPASFSVREEGHGTEDTTGGTGDFGRWARSA